LSSSDGRLIPSNLNVSSAHADISPADLHEVKARTANEGLRVRAYRFAGDALCKPERFATLRGALGPAFLGTELPDEAANPHGLKAQGRAPHSVFTTHLIDAAGQPTREAVNEIIAFFEHALKPW
jgi:hypothetical protein